MREEKADSIFKNAEIYSVDMEGTLCISEAMAVKDDRFLFVGSNAEVEKYASEKTIITDLEGKTVLPGFTDSHIHPTSTAEIINDFSVAYVMNSRITDRAAVIKEFQKAIKENRNAQQNPKILRGVGWDATFFLSTDEGLPTCREIDEVCADVPVIMRSFCHHYIWANSKALEEAGIDASTPTPRNGVIVRDSQGNPTGIFQETTAMDLLIEKLPVAEYSLEQYKDAILTFQEKYANAFGTLLIFDAYPSKKAICAYHELAREGKLTMRVNGSYYADPSKPLSQFDRFIKEKEKYDVDDIFCIKTVKFFVDGSGFSFLMKKPFEKAALLAAGLPEDYTGYSQWNLPELKEIFAKLNAAGMQVHMHCMGDGAVAMVLDAWEHVASKSDIKKNRHVIAHVMNIDDEDMKRMADLEILAAMQPSWCKMTAFHDKSAQALIGKERSENNYPIGRLKKAGVTITSGTDFPVYVPPNPFEGIENGITRKIQKTHPEYEMYRGVQLGPDEDKMTLMEMIQSYCINGAYQCFREDVTGTVEAGKSADFVILNEKLTSVKEDDIISLDAERVYFKGNRVK